MQLSTKAENMRNPTVESYLPHFKSRALAWQWITVACTHGYHPSRIPWTEAVFPFELPNLAPTEKDIKEKKRSFESLCQYPVYSYHQSLGS